MGSQTIGRFGSLCYLVNQIFGPGVLAIPAVFVDSGLIPSALMNLVVFFWSCASASMLLRAISLIPGNSELKKRIEYASAVEHYFGVRAAKAFQVFLHLSLQSLNIASIIVTAQSFDHMLLESCGYSFSLRLYDDGGGSLGFRRENKVARPFFSCVQVDFKETKLAFHLNVRVGIMDYRRTSRLSTTATTTT